jgi:succinoglycan biosynthesis protein ExoO
VRKFDDERITLIEHPENLGEGAARDTAIRSSRGEWIAVLDADDAWAEQRLERLLSLEPSIKGSHMLLDNLMRCYERHGRMCPWKPLWSGDCDFLQREEQSLKDYLLLPSLLIKPLVPRKAIVDSSLRHSSLRFSADTEFFIRLVKKANLKFKVAPESLYHYRLTPGSMSALPEKSILMKDMFLGLKSELAFSGEEEAAIDRRIETLDRNIDYMAFLQEMRGGNYAGAIKALVSKPSRIAELMRRLPDTIRYRMFLLRQGGRAR